MMSSATDNRGGAGRAVLVGVLVVIGLGIVASGAWFVLGSGAGPDEASASDAKPAESSASAIEAALAAARTYSSNKEFGKASAILRAAVEEHADDQALRLAYAETLLAQQETAKAYEQYEAALAIGPQDASIELAAGTLATQIGKDDRALEHFSMARAADPGSAEIALYLGVTQQRLGQTGDAKANLLAALELDDTSAVAPAALAQIALDENQLSLAGRYIARARQADPEQLAYRILEARILNRRGKPKQAVTLLKALPEEQFYQPMVLDLMAASYGLLRQPESAAAMYVAASEREPAVAEFPFQAALWFERSGDLESAARFAKQAAMLGHAQGRALVDRLSGG